MRQAQRLVVWSGDLGGLRILASQYGCETGVRGGQNHGFGIPTPWPLRVIGVFIPLLALQLHLLAPGHSWKAPVRLSMCRERQDQPCPWPWKHAGVQGGAGRVSLVQEQVPGSSTVCEQDLR